MKYKITTITVLMVLLLTNINLINAQSFTPAKTIDNVAGNATNLTMNTGNDINYFEYGYFQISVWDGDIGTLGYDYGQGNGPETPLSLDGNQYGLVEDPDVVLHVLGDTLYAYVIYIVEGKVRYEVHSFYQGLHALLTSSTAIYNANTCSNPNVDIDEFNHLAAVWTDSNNGNTIMIAYSDILFGSPSITQAWTDGYNPDVAVWFNYTTLAAHVRITANNDYAQKNCVIVLKNNLWSSGTFSGLNKCEITKPDYFGRPRIAAINGSEQYEMVVSKHENGAAINTIIGCNYNSNGMVGTPTTLNQNLDHYYNSDPVVSFIFNTIVVAWTHESYLSDKKDIIQQKLYATTGIPYAPNVFEVVNKSTNNNQLIASVSGRFASSPYVHYTFVDDYENMLKYKLGNINNNYVRLQNSITSSSVSPNPATNNISIQLNNEIENANISIYNLNGKKLKEYNYTINNSYDISDLSSGIYFIEISTVNNIETLKLIIN